MDNQKIREITATISKTMAGNKMRVFGYISGKVTGLEPADVKYKFAKSEDRLIMQSVAPFNPTQWIKPDCNWQQAMRLCLAILPLCDLIFMQSDWQSSDGAIWEHDTAKRLGLEVIYEDKTTAK